MSRPTKVLAISGSLRARSSNSEVLKAAVPNTLKLNVRIELDGEPKPSEAKLKAINAILAKVKKGLELK